MSTKTPTTKSEWHIRRIQELRRSGITTPHVNKSKYTRKIKHKAKNDN